MAGLVGYASSEDESGDDQPQLQVPAPSKQTQTPPQPSQPATTAPEPAVSVSKPQPSGPKPPPARETPAPGAALPPPGAAPLGPSLPPMDSSALGSLPEPPALDDDASAQAGVAPSSPYTTARSLIHDLTLPAVPNFDIPVSPPGSPPPAAAATGQRFAHFLELKKKGTHFNAKLEQSSAQRNPALTDKLLWFVDIPPPRGDSNSSNSSNSSNGQKSVLQYQTTLPADVWDPGAFPAWAFRDGLRKGRDRVAKEREAARAAPGRTSVEFVSSTTTTTTSGGSREKRKGGWQ
ncbi:hypothetical protein V2A60_000536 [Cordyceps javanica]